MAFKEIGCELNPSKSEKLHVNSCNYSNTFWSFAKGEKFFPHMNDFRTEDSNTQG
jgi:hypothetical protein